MDIDPPETPVEIDFAECLERNHFLDNPHNRNTKAALCLRILLFIDSLHDFGDTGRTKDINDPVVKKKIMPELLSKLIKDLDWILENIPPDTSSRYYEILQKFVTNMSKNIEDKNNLIIKSIFFGSAAMLNYNKIRTILEASPAPGEKVETEYFSLIEEKVGLTTTLYFYPKIIGEKEFTALSQNDQEDITYYIRDLFKKNNRTNPDLKQDSNQNYLHTAVNQLMKYIFDHDKDIDDKDIDDIYIIYIIACLIYFWQPDKNKYNDSPLPLNFDNVKLSTYVHDLFFKYIIKYSLNCFTIIPTTNHNITCGAWQFITSIIQYLCYQNPYLAAYDVPIVSTEYDEIEPKNDKCKERMQNLFTESTQKLINFNLISFFQKDVSFLIDAAGKNRSVNYLSQTFIDIFRDPFSSTKKFRLFKTSASLFDSAQPPNLETSMKLTDKDTFIDSVEYTNNRTFIVKCGTIKLIKIKFVHKLEGEKHIYSIVFEKFFSDIPNPSYEVSQDSSSLVKSIEKFKETNNVFSLIGKSMGDFGQILFYYLLQKDSGYFSGTSPTALTIFHTLDTWAASICSLFANGVICEESSDSLRQDEGNLPYKFGNNKMFVSKTLKDRLINTMTPSIYLPTVGGADEYHDIWSKLPLKLGQIQEWTKFKAEHEEKIIILNQELNEYKEKYTNLEKNYIRQYEVLEDTVIKSLKTEAFWEQKKDYALRKDGPGSHDVIQIQLFIDSIKEITKKAKDLLGPEKIQELVKTLKESENIINEKEQEITKTIYKVSELIKNDSKKRERDTNIATPSLPNSSAAADTASVDDAAPADDAPTSKKQKIVGGVMTRSMVLKQKLLDQQILKQKLLDQQIESSFDNIDEQITDLRNSALEIKTFIEKNREQLEELNLPIPELPNLDVDDGPISSRTRYQIALAKKQSEEKQQQQQSALPLPARARPLQQSQSTPPPPQSFSRKRGRTGGTKKTIKNKYKL